MFKERYYRQLQEQVNLKKCKETFERVKSQHSIFEFYPTVESLCNLFKPGNKNYDHKNQIMTILLTELHKSNVIYPVINLMFWNSLSRLYRWRQLWVADKESLWDRIQCNFYHSVMNHNLERLPIKIDVNIFLNTKNKVIAWEQKELRYKRALKALENLHKAGLTADLERSKIYPDEMEVYLLDMVYRKIITETQYDLVLETLVYKRVNMKEWALKTGISYNTVRNLRYRAEMAIKNFEDKSKKNKET